MNSIHLKHCERGQRSVSFIDSQPESFPDGSKAASLSTLIKQELVKLAELDVIRSSSMSKQLQATAARQKAHRLLLRTVKSVTGTAEVVALDHTNIEGMFVRPQRNSSSQTLIADARALADKVPTLIGLFTENGLAATVVNDLRSYADSLEHAIQLQTDSIGERMRANADIEKVIRHMKELIDRLDIIVRNKYANDEAKLTAWQSARHLERSARSRRNGDKNAPPPAQQ